MNKLEQAALVAPDGYALVSIDALKAWGKYDEVRNACQYPAEQVEQEPVAWAHPSGGYLSARYMKEFATGLEKETHTIPLYAAPVRTKDLTDDEIAAVWRKADSVKASKELFDFLLLKNLVIARAVIAADREKNK